MDAITKRAPTCGDSGGRNTAGEPCESQILLDSGRCAHHDPERAEEMRLARAAGGRATAEIVRLSKRIKDTVAPANMPDGPDTLDDVAAWHRWTARSVACGEIDGRTAGEITRALKELRPVLASIDMESRVKELEKQLKRARKELERR